MRNWVFIVVIGAGVLGVGGIASIVMKEDVVEAAADQVLLPGMPDGTARPEQRSGNPLLTATYEQFGVWYPYGCEAYLYMGSENELEIKKCLHHVKRKVEFHTGVKLASEDILSPAVVTHWKKIMGL